MQTVIFTTLFRRWFDIENNIEIDSIFSTLPSVVNINFRTDNVDSALLNVVNFNRLTQRCFNVDLRFPDVATSYQSNNNVQTTLKCLLEVLQYRHLNSAFPCLLRPYVIGYFSIEISLIVMSQKWSHCNLINCNLTKYDLKIFDCNRSDWVIRQKDAINGWRYHSYGSLLHKLRFKP